MSVDPYVEGKQESSSNGRIPYLGECRPVREGLHGLPNLIISKDIEGAEADVLSSKDLEQLARELAAWRSGRSFDESHDTGAAGQLPESSGHFLR